MFAFQNSNLNMIGAAFILIAAVSQLPNDEKTCSECEIAAVNVNPNPRPMPSYIRNYAEKLSQAILEHASTSLSDENLYEFLEMDLIYLENYLSWIYPGLHSCKEPGKKLLASGVLGRLPFPDSSVMYYKDAVLNNQSAIIPPENDALKAYREFYQAQTNCEDTMASAMVCLCSYSIVAFNLQDAINHERIPSSQYLDNFIKYNIVQDPYTTGTTCTYADEFFITNGTMLNITLLNEALQHEQALWHATN
eukprot:m.340691 g.340691  ORF g.340691 m.340691 type:complete len:250 (+) comp19461_c0_seq1:178-927(+)